MLNILKIKKKFFIYWGVDDMILKKGVGMFVSDLMIILFGGGYIVLSGYWDIVFIDLGELKEKDIFILEYDNKMYIYEI